MKEHPPDKGRVVRIGTSGSQLAMRQAEGVQQALRRAWPELGVELEIIRTTGDRMSEVPLADIGGKGVFVKEIEEALLAGRVDLAVHSMKDVPTLLPEGLHIGAITEREDPRDVLVASGPARLAELAPGARLGTSSLRRQAQILFVRPDLRVVPLRGNLDTRLRKMREGQVDALVLAAAGLRRMGWESWVRERIDEEVLTPAAGQGALGIEVRAGDAAVGRWVRALNHPPTAKALVAEWAFLQRLGGGCTVPMGAYARLAEGGLLLSAVVARADGSDLIRARLEGDPREPEGLGVRLAEVFLERGVAGLLPEGPPAGLSGWRIDAWRAQGIEVG